jgi:hypothetical protein
MPGPPYKVDPGDWQAQLISAQTLHGPLVVNNGTLTISKHTFSSDGQRVEARLQCWDWVCAGDPEGTWWVGQLLTYSSAQPIALRFIPGNTVLRVGDRCWRFGWTDGQQAFVFFTDREEIGLLISSPPGVPPDSRRVADLLRALGFAVGEPFALGFLVQLDECGRTTGLAGTVRSDDRRSRHTQGQPPAIPCLILGADLADFVDLALMAQAGAFRVPIVVAISHYFHGLDQALDSEFIHNWIAAEGLAKTICSSPEFGSTSEDPPLVRDPSAWRQWVKSNRQAIHEQANPNEADRLYNRVMNMSQRDGKVDRAFRVLGLPWAPAMNDVQDIRNFAIHEGVIAGTASPASREWDRDRRLGFVGEGEPRSGFAEAVDRPQRRSVAPQADHPPGAGQLALRRDRLGLALVEGGEEVVGEGVGWGGAGRPGGGAVTIVPTASHGVPPCVVEGTAAVASAVVPAW